MEFGRLQLQTTCLSTDVNESFVKKQLGTAQNPELRGFSRRYFVNKTAVYRDMFINILRVSTQRIGVV